MADMLTFPRLAALSEDVSFILDAIAECGSSLIEVDEVKHRVRRNPE